VKRRETIVMEQARGHPLAIEIREQIAQAERSFATIFRAIAWGARLQSLEQRRWTTSARPSPATSTR